MKRNTVNKNKNLFQSLRNAYLGLLHAAKSERNMKFHIIAAFLVLILSIYYRLKKEEIMIVTLTILLVLVCELFNTAIELLVDAMYQQFHPKARVVKDLAAGAVMLSAAASLVVAYLVFFERVLETIREILS